MSATNQGDDKSQKQRRSKERAPPPMEHTIMTAIAATASIVFCMQNRVVQDMLDLGLRCSMQSHPFQQGCSLFFLDIELGCVRISNTGGALDKIVMSRLYLLGRLLTFKKSGWIRMS